jgi:hypothetical protein
MNVSNIRKLKLEKMRVKKRANKEVNKKEEVNKGAYRKNQNGEKKGSLNPNKED